MVRNKTYPLYRRAKEWVVVQINTEKLKPGQKVPSENEIVEKLKISRMTANRALRELTDEGYLTRIQGVGTFVSMYRPQNALLEIKSIADEISGWGGQHRCEVILQREEVATQSIASTLGILRGGRIYHTILLHMDKDLPILYSDRYVNPAIAPEYINQNFEKITPNEYLKRIAPIEEAEHIVEAIIPVKKIRELLKIKKNEPCLLLHRRVWSLGKIATNSQLIYPGSRYRLGGRFRTGSISVSSPA